MPDQILAADFNTAIPVDLRPYIAVASNPLPLTFSPILEAFRIAANLSRVFGELMYLLEYREESIPLAAGEKLNWVPQV